MDVDYGCIKDQGGKCIDVGEWENVLFILISVMSYVKVDKVICDVGLKVQLVDSGLFFVYGCDDVEYIKCSDEYGVIVDFNGVLQVNDKLCFVFGYCDLICNVYDWYVGVCNGCVECVWLVLVCGKGY